MAQTSVEWLFYTMQKTPMNEWYKVLEQAKAMHKEECENAFNNGMNCSADYFEAWSKTTESENYYNQTFNK